uniref:fructose-bisphosphate aldolase n=1 Tax=Eucampia antarctica TaxID=49252 RepID=A0A7S2RWF8_9STRA|eukprot:CAMPEP_0197831844 /NCGR_PEP_ID=MMETSP1437-20131217/12347_1 /TAXON_ID=49252 ORGANISM="Eucampia antarctica, Strain CCMP1452" /NCGR_SAMPLE_ID=MMETSP1437 /ASSEMBLY_ACC=CAM_ASM_001096 /LENGTH=296 /DNA_ID=CAMNT_0043434937 /DNA_START=32 /DNA_END=922 /DNA_ORIENTATION=+
MTFQEQLDRARNENGFLAALDQSGGSTPKALRLYGISDCCYVEGETSMYDTIHAMRSRIITSPAFDGDRILGAILFENTMNREIEGLPTAQFLWDKKKVISLLKVDKGLAAEENGVQLMKPMPDLDILLKHAKGKGVFGTKMRSVVKLANKEGIDAIVAQQFEIGKRIIAAGLVPILEPEVDITSPDKAKIEAILKTKILEHLDQLGEKEDVILKLSLPSVDNHYKELVDHPKCVRVVALSGGYPRKEANAILKKQDGMIASFSRALTESLNHNMNDDDFNKVLGECIASIYDASK